MSLWLAMPASVPAFVRYPSLMFPLILECSRIRPDPNELRRLAVQCSDWDQLIRSASRHRVTPLMFWTLNQACPDAVPPEILAKLRESFRQSTKHNLTFANELLRLLDLFGQAGIQAIPFKGPALAWMVYEAPGLRRMSDLDLLIPQRDLSCALDLLTSNGYRQLAPQIGMRFFLDTGQLALKRADGLTVDLHWRLVAAHFDPLDAAQIRARLAPIDVAGRLTPAFCPEDLLTFLCVHGAKHGWDSLAGICDLDRLIASRSLDWDAILSRAARQRISRVVSLGLCLAQDLLGSNLPPEVAKRIQANTSTVALATSIRARLQDGHAGSSSQWAILKLRMMEGPWRKFRLLWYRLQPTDADWSSLHLPEFMFPVYYLTRPVRLAWKCCLRGRSD